jgi:hypothetical protein
LSILRLHTRPRVPRVGDVERILRSQSIRGRSHAWCVLVSVSHTTEEPMVRVLVTVEPRMYRQAIALSVQRTRPNSEVLLAPEDVLDGQVEDFAPHVLLRSDSHSLIPEEKLGSSVVLRVEVLYTDHMAARVSVAGGDPYTIEDASMEDLLSLVDEAEALVAPLHPEDKRVKTLLRSLSVLDEWLDKNEGRIDDEARVRRIKGWREEALHQLGLLQEGGRP